jgi:GntR family transcriptional regulator
VIEFQIQTASAVAPYRQLVSQVRQALRLGVLDVGDQLPTVKETAAMVAINPNTVTKAYRELEIEGLVEGRPGVGTFVVRSLVDGSLVAHKALQRDLTRWVAKAREAGLDDDSIAAVFESTLYQQHDKGVA